MALPDLAHKTAVITGASRGLGAGIATVFAAHGMRLGLCARSAPEDASLQTTDRILFEQLDVTDGPAVDRFATAVSSRFGHIDLWINNAGVLDPVRFVHDLDTASLMDHLLVNVAGVLHGSQAYARRLRLDEQRRGGVLVNISSGAALKGYAGWACYCSGKAAVDRLTECLQLEEQAHGLRAHAVAPGVIDTAMQTTIRSLSADRFPAVDKFHDLKRRNAFNSPTFVADKLLQLAFGSEAPPDAVVLRLPNEADTRR